jgi:hypothetical protein
MEPDGSPTPLRGCRWRRANASVLSGVAVARGRNMKVLKDNGLTIVLMLLFALSVGGQAYFGWRAALEELAQHGRGAEPFFSYLRDGEFLSTLFENWESEFLQMAAYVVLTAHLFQRGSAESRDPDNPDREHDEPYPGLWGKLHAHSLGLAMALLFAASFALHLFYSARHAAEEAQMHGESAPRLVEHLGEAQFWFESFQNWQSEFFSTAVLVLFSIFLRERGSPESKPVRAANAETGD